MWKFLIPLALCITLVSSANLLFKLLGEKKTSVSSVLCPDGHSECDSGSTCCKTGNNAYGCCPVTNAVCCSDHKHCCPAGYHCTSDSCTKQDGSSIVYTKTAAIQYVKAKQVGSSGTSKPLQKIECCDTKCCPSGYKCIKNGQCQKLPNTFWKMIKNLF